jgi:hypothetical protein
VSHFGRDVRLNWNRHRLPRNSGREVGESSRPTTSEQ